MAKAPTATTSQQDEARDALPEPDDDIEQSETLDAARDGADDGATAAPDKAKSEKPLSPRDRVVARYKELQAERERQAKEMAETAEVANDDAADAGDDEEEPAPAAAAAKQPAATDPPEQQVTLVIDGKPVAMKLSEALAKAQIAVASDNRLEEAKRILGEAKALAQRGQTGDREHPPGDEDDLNAQDDAAPDPKAKANQPKPRIDREKLKEVVQRLQVGDEDEGLEALAEFADLVSSSRQDGSGIKPDQLGPVVAEHIARDRIKGEIVQAAETFKSKYQDIAGDPELVEISLARMRNEMRQDLASAGMDATQLNALDHDKLMQLHQEARLKGIKVRDYASMFDKIGSDVSAKYGVIAKGEAKEPAQQQNGTTRLQERLDRKRAAPSQPRTAGVRVSPPQQAQKRTPLQVIADMARARGKNPTWG